MPSSFRVEVELPIPADVLWRVRASRPFTSYLVSIGALSRMDSTPARAVPGHASLRTRIQTYVPATIAIPEVVKSVFDDSYIEISDTQTWDHNSKSPLEQRFDIRPSVMAHLVKSSGKLVVTPAEHAHAANNASPDTCLHVLSGECSVDVPFLGWYIEQAIIANMRTFYDQYPGHIGRFVDMAVRRWGNGNVASLRVAVDKMLAEEKAAE